MEKEKIDVRLQQIQMAQNMGIPKEGLDFLAALEEREWKKRELYYICLLDGIPVDQLQNNEKRGTDSINWIQKLRMDYWRNKNTATSGSSSPLGKEVEKLKSEVQMVCKESRDVRVALEQNLEKLIKKQVDVQQEALSAKNQIIEILKGENEKLNRQVIELESQIAELSKEMEQRQGQQKTCREPHVISGQQSSKKIGILQELMKAQTTKKFIEGYIKNPVFSAEQKEFILNCLEDGITIREIEKIAIPGITVNMMERLKQLCISGRSIKDV